MKQSSYLVILLLLFIPCILSAQATKKGKVRIEADPKIEELVAKNIEFNKKIKQISGYRILIASLSGNNSKSSAFRMKDAFLAEYPGMGAYIVFEEPNFKVKVGDFKTRLEAYAFYQQIKGRYPCTIIQDNIAFSKASTDSGELIEETEFEEK